MRKISVIFLMILSVFIITSCSKSKKDEFEVYVNDVGYNIGDELFVEVFLTTTDTEVLVCPIIKFYKEDEKDMTNISKSLNFTTDHVEFINLFGTDFSEILNEDHLSFEAKLSNLGEEIDLTNETLIERVKITLTEKGKYTISLDENNSDEECTTYKNSLKINITKNEER